MDQQQMADGVTSLGAKLATAAGAGAGAGNLFMSFIKNPAWWNVIIGAVGVIGTLAINYYFKRRDSRIAAAIAAKEHGVRVDD